MGDARLGRLPLGGGLEEKFIDLAHGQALGQKIEWTVLGSVTVTVAVGLAAAGKAFHQRSAQAVWSELKLGHQPAFALAQGQCGFARSSVNLCHMYGKDSKTSERVKQ